MPQHITVGIATCNAGSTTRYQQWLYTLKSSIRCVEVGNSDDPLRELSQCNGLVLPGGGDPAPALFGATDPSGLCNVNTERDRLEVALIERALECGIPILGICRGLQIVNVALGGSLILDLPKSGYTMHQHPEEVGKADGASGDDSLPVDATHAVAIEEGTFLHVVTETTIAYVSSNHHQGIADVAPVLSASAHAPDEIIEALEWNPSLLQQVQTAPVEVTMRTAPGKQRTVTLEKLPYMLLVHWHPERMDYNTVCSKRIGESFLTACAG